MRRAVGLTKTDRADLRTIAAVQADKMDVIVDRLPGLDLAAKKEQLVAERGNNLGRAAERVAVEEALPRARHFSCGHRVSYPKLCCRAAPKGAFVRCS